MEHEGGGGVSEGVAVAVGDAGGSEVGGDDVADVGGADGCGVAGDEEGVGVGSVAEELGSGGGEVVVDPGGGALAGGQESVASAFALVDEEGVLVGVDVVEVEVGEFAASDAGGVEDFEHAAVASAERGGEVGEREDVFGLLCCEVVAWELEGRGRQFDRTGRVVVDVAVGVEPSVETADGDEVLLFGAGRQWCAGGGDVTVEVEPVGVHGVVVDVDRCCDVVVDRPLGEAGECSSAAVHGVRGQVAKLERQQVLLDDGVPAGGVVGVAGDRRGVALAAARHVSLALPDVGVPVRRTWKRFPGRPPMTTIEPTLPLEVAQVAAAVQRCHGGYGCGRSVQWPRGCLPPEYSDK